MGKIIKLNPFISKKVWGGKRLAKLKNLNQTDDSEPIGETWEVSTHSAGSSFLGEAKLSSVCELSYLVKFIDTSANLSIQVHPDEEYAKEHEDSRGKTECWIILDAKKGAGIYLGFKKGVTKKEFFTAVASGMQVDKYLNFIPVKTGDFFFIPAGSIHAIGNDITLCEVQQSSGITYRVWDWNRMGMDGKPRELHVEKAKDVCQFSDSFNDQLLAYSKNNLLDLIGISTIAEHDDFNIQIFSNLTQKDMELTLKDKDSLIVLRGSIAGDIKLSALDCGIVLEAGTFDLKVESGTSFLVVSE